MPSATMPSARTSSATFSMNMSATTRWNGSSTPFSTGDDTRRSSAMTPRLGVSTTVRPPIALRLRVRRNGPVGEAGASNTGEGAMVAVAGADLVAVDGLVHLQPGADSFLLCGGTGKELVW